MAVAFHDVTAARARLAGVAVRTPLLQIPAANEAVGGILLIKFEGVQREGSFKFRGAYNRLVQLTAEERERGVVAWSSGNHAQGVASAARLLSTHATIVMPADAPQVKIQNTLRLGAKIVFYDRATESREQIARRLCADQGSVLVPSYDDPHIIAGQGTMGIEIAEQAYDQRCTIDQVLVPCGGGGLVAGNAIALQTLTPQARVYSVEPLEFDDTARSVALGSIQRNRPEARSICDALLTPEPGELTFPINRLLLAGTLAVSDDEVRAAMVFAFATLRLVVEPGGAVALAAALTGKVKTKGVTTVVVLSGSNPDPAMYCQILSNR
jgi:threonine dehydratase